jgi:hypothetical protein
MEYRYASKKSKNSYAGGEDYSDVLGSPEEIPTPLDPFEKAQKTKSYVPPTRLEPQAQRPFGAVLDAPLN